MKALSLFTLLLAPLAHAQTDEALPQMLLGRGIITKLNVTSADDMRQENKLAMQEKREAAQQLEQLKKEQQLFIKYLDEVDEINKSTVRRLLEKNKAKQEELLAIINNPIHSAEEIDEAKVKAKERSTIRYFVGFECVNRDNLGNLNCFQVQPVLVDLTAQKTIARGNILLIGNRNSELNAATQPSEKEIKAFMKEFKEQFTLYKRGHMTEGQEIKDFAIKFFTIPALLAVPIVAVGIGGGALLTTSVGMGGALGVYYGINFLDERNLKVTNNRELTDTRGFGWSSNPKRLSKRNGTLFRDFILQYQNY